MIITKLKAVVSLIKLVVHRVARRTWPVPEITADQLFEHMNAALRPLVIDVRSDYNGQRGHILNAISIPLIELHANLEVLQSFKDKEMVIICRGGVLSMIAADILSGAGFKNVKSLRGGMASWYRNGYPTTIHRQKINHIKPMMCLLEVAYNTIQA